MPDNVINPATYDREDFLKRIVFSPISCFNGNKTIAIQINCDNKAIDNLMFVLSEADSNGIEVNQFNQDSMKLSFKKRADQTPQQVSLTNTCIHMIRDLEHAVVDHILQHPDRAHLVGNLTDEVLRNKTLLYGESNPTMYVKMKTSRENPHINTCSFQLQTNNGEERPTYTDISCKDVKSAMRLSSLIWVKGIFFTGSMFSIQLKMFEGVIHKIMGDGEKTECLTSEVLKFMSN